MSGLGYALRAAACAQAPRAPGVLIAPTTLSNAAVVFYVPDLTKPEICIAAQPVLGQALTVGCAAQAIPPVWQL
jgi:hypothetical protein